MSYASESKPKTGKWRLVVIGAGAVLGTTAIAAVNSSRHFNGAAKVSMEELCNRPNNGYVAIVDAKHNNKALLSCPKR